jgi:hypothetical protein
MLPLQTTTAESNVQQDVMATLMDGIRDRPRNTTLAYTRKQDEFMAWMREQNFIDSTTVTAAKIVSFLRRNVVGRASKVKPDSTVGFSTVRTYCAACVDLYAQQKALNSNSNPHPKDDSALKTLLASVRSQENRTRRTNYADRAAGTIQDGYSSTEQLASIVRYHIDKNTCGSHRDRLMFLLGHFCLMRGECVRRIELADMFALDLENEGFSPCKALVIIMDQG